MTWRNLWWSGLGGLVASSFALFGATQTSTASTAPECQVWVSSGVGSSNITIIDSWTSSPSTLPIGGAHGPLTFNRSGTKVFVSMQNTGVKMVDVRTLVVSSIAAGGLSAGSGSFGPIAASPTVNLILVAADDGTNVNHYTALNSETGAQVGSIFPIAKRSAAIAFGPTGVAYSLEVLVPSAPKVDVIDATVPMVTSQFNVGATVSETFSTAVVAAPAGQTPLLFVGGYDGGVSSFKAINANTGAVDATVSLANVPYGMAVSPTGDRLFVTQPQLNAVRVFDTLSRAPIATISVGANPNGLAVSPDGRFLYVANNGSNTLSKIDLTSLAVVETIQTNPNPLQVAIGPVGCVAVEPQAVPPTAVGATTTTTTVTVPALVESSSKPTRNSLPPTGHSGPDTNVQIALAFLVAGMIVLALTRRRRTS